MCFTVVIRPNRSEQRRGYRDGVLLTAPMQSSD
jgi:hypothetical protein